MRLASLVFLVTILAGCATERTILVNSRGDVLTCQTEGYGLFGAVSVRNQHRECISDAEKRGYRVKHQ